MRPCFCPRYVCVGSFFLPSTPNSRLASPLLVCAHPKTLYFSRFRSTSGPATMDPSNYVQCPYEPSHSILKTQIQFHLLKDHPNYVGPRKEPCPFNTTHLIDVALLEEHKRTCPDRGIIDNFVVSVGRDTLPQGIAPVTNYNISYDDSDIWDDQPSSESILNRIKQAAEEKPILINSVGLPKAKKREHILQERRRHQKLDEPQHSKPVPRLTQQSSSSVPVRPNFPGEKYSTANPPMPTSVPHSETTNSQSISNGASNFVKTASSEPAVPNNNEADFPSLDGNAGNRPLRRNAALSGFLKGADVKEAETAQTKPATNAWGKPLERSAQEEISVPYGMSRGSRMGYSSQGMAGRSVSNPWARGQGSMTRGTGASYTSNGSREINPSSTDEFPSLSQSTRGKRAM
ncbi:U11-48K-like Hypothetical proteinHC zinc finger [Nesidiocoris tenuis]|uniref:CHHC U11-48K-type domain-containing protein n=1 Tax=Nesidiocoris tenuis TaxID=355587 RepID=A0ABN7A5X2_9HEMI|nr:U11-48K-like Hypothetical proteinHC zinc finger [Nesidiocoris tenuis]